MIKWGLDKGVTRLHPMLAGIGSSPGAGQLAIDPGDMLGSILGCTLFLFIWLDRKTYFVPNILSASTQRSPTPFLSSRENRGAY